VLRPRTLLAALALVALPACLRFPAGTPEHPRIAEFEIVGTKAISQDELKQRLATQSSWRKYGFLPQPEYFDPDASANDLRRILRFYQARGYYRARIEGVDRTEVSPGVVKIRVRVFEGPPVRVASLEFPGLEAAPEAKANLGTLPLKVGEVFTEEAYDATRLRVQAVLADNGWAKAEVGQHAEVDPELDQARVQYPVKAGDRFRFGNVYVAGSAVVPRARIREEAQRVIEPGTTFNASELPKAQARVFDLGVFGGVRVTPGQPDEVHKTVNPVVSVREAPFRTIRAGPGFTFQAARWEADAILGWQHRNWLGGLRKLNLDLRAGYAWLPNVFNPQKRGFVGLATADFTQPGLIGHLIDLNVRGELQRGLEQAYDFYAERLRLGTPIRLGRVFTFVPSVNLELYQLGGQVGTAAVGTGGTSNQVLTLSTCPGHNPNLCLLSYFEQRVSLDFRDDPINTKKGLFLGFSVQEGFTAFGLGSSYLRFLPEARAFVDLGDGFVVGARGRIGLIQLLAGTTDVPIVAKFVSGGPNLMRGYYTTQLAPSVFNCPPPGTLDPTASPSPGHCSVQPQYLPIGGNGLVDGSLEFRFPLQGALSGAAFLDFGNVRVAAADVLDLADVQYAVGAGIRYNTIVGPIRLDVGVRLPIPGRDGVEVLENVPVVDPHDPTKVTGTVLQPVHGVRHEPPHVSVHLSIGEAF
jgi:translocation and assembly module TamA